jgi:hypothetical protein
MQVLHQQALPHSFGLADRVVEIKDKQENTFPAVFVSNSYDPISMVPSDNYQAFCFWLKEAEAKIPDYPISVGFNPMLTYNVSCVFFCDLSRISTTLSWKEVKSKVRQETLAFFKSKIIGLGLTLKMISIIDDDITRVYEGFTMEQIDNRFMMMPNYAIRYNFELSFFPECT